MAMIGLSTRPQARPASAATRSYSARASTEVRFSPNSEMSAPETNALPPAPDTTTTRTSGSAWKASRMRGTACCMSIDRALRRAGLL